MSEVNVEFYAYFEDLATLEYASAGFELIRADAFAEAHAHFSSSRIHLWLDAASPQWAVTVEAIAPAKRVPGLRYSRLLVFGDRL